MYLSILLITTSLGIYMQIKLREIFSNYARFQNGFGLSGKEVAEKILLEFGLNDIRVISLPNRLRDHYNPSDKVINLSPEVYGGRSISAAAIAAHECGHVLQEQNGYKWLNFRSALAPIVSFLSRVISLIMTGLILIATFTNGFDLHLVWFIMALAQLTIILFSLLVLPIELDASRRAMDWMKGTELNRTDQLSKMSDAMKWASFTYLIMALTAIVHLLNYFNFFQASSKQK